MKSLRDTIRTYSRKTPDKVAVKFEDININYYEFDNMLTNVSGNILDRLSSLYAIDTVFIPLILERSHFLPIAIHSLLAIEKAYVPLDFSQPSARVSALLNEINSPLVICSQKFAKDVQALCEFCVVTIEELAKVESLASLSPIVYKPKIPCYMIYTSGTTGMPKGVVNINEGLMNRIGWMRDHYLLDEHSVFLQKTPMTFDVSVWELTLPFLVGATLVVGGPKIHLKINEVFKLINLHKVTDIHFVPAVFQVFLSRLESKNISSLKRIYFSGEALNTELTKNFFEYMGDDIDLHNLYGPTECSIDVSSWKCSKTDFKHFSITPIGKPIFNTEFYVLDETGRKLGAEQIGELFIGGLGVSQGYYLRDKLTKQKFIENPFSYSNGKLYSTGDLVKQNQNGDFEYHGRIDFQVKINGQRVELGEIENHILKISGVIGAVAIYTNQTLFSFVETSTDSLVFDSNTVKTFLANYLPSYMIPKLVVRLESIPLGSSGKVDRKKLLELVDTMGMGT